MRQGMVRELTNDELLRFGLACPFDACECGDYRHQHSGPENRGSCKVCRDGTPPPDGPDGCQRYRHHRSGHPDHPSIARRSR